MTGGRGKTGVTAAQAMLLAGRGRRRRSLKAHIRKLQELLADMPTQAATARQLGLSEGTVSRYERGVYPKAFR
jgi:transcriptional regulator with XRE-family HTH domain